MLNIYFNYYKIIPGYFKGTGEGKSFLKYILGIDSNRYVVQESDATKYHIASWPGPISLKNM